MGLIDGDTRDECKAEEALMKSYAADEQWYQAWAVHFQAVVLTCSSCCKIKAYEYMKEWQLVCMVEMAIIRSLYNLELRVIKRQGHAPPYTCASYVSSHPTGDLVNTLPSKSFALKN